MVEMTAFGAVLAAGFAVGVWSMHNVQSNYDTFVPAINEDRMYNLALNCSTYMFLSSKQVYF